MTDDSPNQHHDDPLWGRLTVVCASANPDKVAEIAAIVEPAMELLARPSNLADVVEDADTLEGNARLKAMAVATATGRPAVADDTGLEVDALGGAPGVLTARFAGPGASYAANRRRLLRELDGVPLQERTARFRTVAMICWPDGREVLADGVCEGVIALSERGARGFGYDAVFEPVEGQGRTFAEMSDDDKHEISHRGRAFRALIAALPFD